MRKAYSTVWKGLFPKSVHITCLAHMANLLGETFKKPFAAVTKFVKNMNAVFWNAGARKGRYLCYLKDANTTPRMPPNPIGTRWNCWYDAVQYHLQHMDVYKAFVASEMLHAKSLAPNSLKELNDVLHDDLEVATLKAHMSFIADKSMVFVKATDFFQSQAAVAMNVWSTLKDLEYIFTDGGVTMRMAESYLPDDFPLKQKMEALDIFNQAYSLLSKWTNMSIDGQPGLHFLRDVQFFNPSKIAVLPSDPSSFPGIPALMDVPVSEVKRYVQDLGPSTVKNGPALGVDFQLFWKSVLGDVPALAKPALRLMFTTTNGADAKRSFSLYNIVHSGRRRSLSGGTLSKLLFLFYNDFVGRDFFD